MKPYSKAESIDWHRRPLTGRLSCCSFEGCGVLRGVEGAAQQAHCYQAHLHAPVAVSASITHQTAASFVRDSCLHLHTPDWFFQHYAQSRSTICTGLLPAHAPCSETGLLGSSYSLHGPHPMPGPLLCEHKLPQAVLVAHGMLGKPHDACALPTAPGCPGSGR